MLKLTVMALLSVTITAKVMAQDPVHFNYEARKISGNQYELHVVATMDAGWHIYAQQQPKAAISQPTVFVLGKSPLIAYQGGLKEMGKRETYKDNVAGITQYQYAGKVEFVQRFTLKSAAKVTLTGKVTYQTCTNEQCLQPKTVDFSVPVE